MRERSFRFADHGRPDAADAVRIDGFGAGRLTAPATKCLTVQIVRHIPQVARTLAVGEARPVDPRSEWARPTLLRLVLAPGALCEQNVSR